jgi:hypothetical protein
LFLSFLFKIHLQTLDMLTSRMAMADIKMANHEHYYAE